MKHRSPARLAELKAKPFDPSTIAKAKFSPESLAKVEPLCAIIEEAFSGVMLGDGVGLREGQARDDYWGDKAKCKSFRALDEKYDWSSIQAAELNRCNSSLSFFDAEGMRFHLPAFLICDLKGEYGFGMDFCLTHLSDYTKTQFALLSAKQRQAVRAFLLHIEDDPEYESGRPHIVRALDEYWTEVG